MYIKNKACIALLLLGSLSIGTIGCGGSETTKDVVEGLEELPIPKVQEAIDFAKKQVYQDSVTYGQMIENFLVSPDWIEFKSDDNRIVIEADGESNDGDKYMFQLAYDIDVVDLDSIKDTSKVYFVYAEKNGEAISTEEILNEMYKLKVGESSNSDAASDAEVNYYGIGDVVKLSNKDEETINIVFKEWGVLEGNYLFFTYEAENIGTTKVDISNAIFDVYVNGMKIEQDDSISANGGRMTLNPTRKETTTLYANFVIYPEDKVEVQCNNVIWQFDPTTLTDLGEETDTKGDASTAGKLVETMSEDEQYEIMMLSGEYYNENTGSDVSISIYSSFEEGNTVGVVEGSVYNESVTIYRFIGENVEYVNDGEYVVNQDGVDVHYTFEQIGDTYKVRISGPDGEDELVMVQPYCS